MFQWCSKEAVPKQTVMTHNGDDPQVEQVNSAGWDTCILTTVYLEPECWSFSVDWKDYFYLFLLLIESGDKVKVNPDTSMQWKQHKL